VMLPAQSRRDSSLSIPAADLLFEFVLIREAVTIEC
jgi:hypothetical protein